MSEITIEPATASGSASDLISTLRIRAPRAAMALAAGQLAWPMAKSLHAKVRDRTSYTIKVLSTDDIYDDLHEWVLGLLPQRDRRSLVAWTTRRDNSSMASPDSPGEDKPKSLRFRYDGSRQQVITIGKHRIKVNVNEGDASSNNERLWKPDEIIFICPSWNAQIDLVAEIEQVVERRAKRAPRFRMMTKWGDWQTIDELPARSLDSVVLASGQLERLVADIQQFLDAEQEFARRSIPWHRGHLYEGPPGTGKTSVARALANHFGMDVWYLPLADVDKDCGLLSAVSRITPRSMLLLEDVDVFHAATQRTEDTGVTLSGLLNALDGIATPQGLLTVLTTNSPDVLDRAIVRPGRIDLTEHFGLADTDQVKRLAERWYGHDVELGMDYFGASPAEIVEAFKRNEHCSDALRDIRRTVHDRLTRTLTEPDPDCRAISPDLRHTCNLSSGHGGENHEHHAQRPGDPPEADDHLVASWPRTGVHQPADGPCECVCVECITGDHCDRASCAQPA